MHDCLGNHMSFYIYETKKLVSIFYRKIEKQITYLVSDIYAQHYCTVTIVYEYIKKVEY